MRRAIERRQEELEDLEDTKCRRKSYALAQRESLPIPLPIPVYPPPKPIARPPPPKTVFRPVGPGLRANTRGYRPSASVNLLPTTPEVPSTPPVRNHHQVPRGVSTLSPTPEEPPACLNNLPSHPANDYRPQPQIPATPDASPKLRTFQGHPQEENQPAETAVPLSDINHTSVITQPVVTSIPTSLPPTPPTHHLPPTPTSLSRSNTPTSLTCPRTPTSIRAAPWQPAGGGGAPTSLIHKVPSSAAYPPTPPSSPSRPDEILDVTPSSSLSSSVEQGLSHSRLSLGSSNLLPDPAPHIGEAHDFSSLNPSVSSYPAVLDVMHLNVDVQKDFPTLESNRSPKDAELAKNDLRRDLPDLPAGDSITSLVKTGPEDGMVNNFNGPDHEGKSHTQPEQTYQTYKRRFWILCLFSATAFLQSTVWGTFGSIAESAEYAFHWTPATIAAFPNWGPIIVVFFTVPMMWVTQKLGLRLGMIACVVLIATATMLRIVTSQEAAFTVLCHIGSILNAFAACLTLSLPAMVAATWFPPDERTTATAVGALWCQLGGAAIYMGPLIVRAPPANKTTPRPVYIDGYIHLGEDIITPEDVRGDIMNLMYIHFAAAAALLIAVFAYFPAVPPSPPSASSAQEKIDFLAGIKATLKNRQLLLVIIVYSFSFGVPVVWIGVLTFSLLEVDIHQDAAMGVAVTAVVCSGIAAFITARITDKVYGHLKITIIALLVASSLFFLWFVLLSTGVVAPSLAQAYISVAGGVSFEYATVPLLVELTVELGYPIPESVVGAILTLLFNIVAVVFLALFQIPDIGYTWASYVLLACVSLTVIPMLFVKETHKRFETDQREMTEVAS